jgi:very-short-patch-repair endonuclease
LVEAMLLWKDTPEGLQARKRNGELTKVRFKKLWSDPVYRQRTLQHMFAKLHLSPTYPEQILFCLLDELFPDTYTFVGDCITVAGWSPDFLDEKGKHIIEFFGERWHGRTPEQIKRDALRLKVFASHGYSVLVIWEKEMMYNGRPLKDYSQVTRKIERFMSGSL